MKQLELLRKQPKAYGGELLKRRKGRLGPRPLTTKDTIHLVLRSSQARGEKSFSTRANRAKIKLILLKFTKKYGVTIISMANVGNHLHFQVKLASRQTYFPFIRAITGSFAMAIGGGSRWGKTKTQNKFWDYRPYTRVVQSYRAFLNLKDYIKINEMEGFGVKRAIARILIERGSYLIPSTA